MDSDALSNTQQIITHHEISPQNQPSRHGNITVAQGSQFETDPSEIQLFQNLSLQEPTGSFNLDNARKSIQEELSSTEDAEEDLPKQSIQEELSSIEEPEEDLPKQSIQEELSSIEEPEEDLPKQSIQEELSSIEEPEEDLPKQSIQEELSSTEEAEEDLPKQSIQEELSSIEEPEEDLPKQSIQEELSNTEEAEEDLPRTLATEEGFSRQNKPSTPLNSLVGPEQVGSRSRAHFRSQQSTTASTSSSLKVNQITTDSKPAINVYSEHNYTEPSILETSRSIHPSSDRFPLRRSSILRPEPRPSAVSSALLCPSTSIIFSRQVPLFPFQSNPSITVRTEHLWTDPSIHQISPSLPSTPQRSSLCCSPILRTGHFPGAYSSGLLNSSPYTFSSRQIPQFTPGSNPSITVHNEQLRTDPSILQVSTSFPSLSESLSCSPISRTGHVPSAYSSGLLNSSPSTFSSREKPQFTPGSNPQLTNTMVHNEQLRTDPSIHQVPTSFPSSSESLCCSPILRTGHVPSAYSSGLLNSPPSTFSSRQILHFTPGSNPSITVHNEQLRTDPSIHQVSTSFPSSSESLCCSPALRTEHVPSAYSSEHLDSSSPSTFNSRQMPQFTPGSNPSITVHNAQLRTDPSIHQVSTSFPSSSERSSLRYSTVLRPGHVPGSYSSALLYPSPSTFYSRQVPQFSSDLNPANTVHTQQLWTDPSINQISPSLYSSPERSNLCFSQVLRPGDGPSAYSSSLLYPSPFTLFPPQVPLFNPSITVHTEQIWTDPAILHISTSLSSSTEISSLYYSTVLRPEPVIPSVYSSALLYSSPSTLSSQQVHLFASEPNPSFTNHYEELWTDPLIPPTTTSSS